MGEARRRGTFEERRTRAMAGGRYKRRDGRELSVRIPRGANRQQVEAAVREQLAQQGVVLPPGAVIFPEPAAPSAATANGSDHGERDSADPGV
jgi:hypothetical protein